MRFFSVEKFILAVVQVKRFFSLMSLFFAPNAPGNFNIS